MYNFYRALTFCALLNICYYFSISFSLNSRRGIISPTKSLRYEGFGIPLKADKSNNSGGNDKGPLKNFPFIDPPPFIKELSFPSLFAGAIGGSIVSAIAIFSPFIFGDESILSSSVGVNNIEKIAEPVTLFQDILVDLNNDYVDKIDTAKLFKTGMKAMLKSLDPYTEFEDLEAAKSMQESVSGKYGGVGLVISNKIDQNPIRASKKDTKPDTGNSVSKIPSQKQAPEKEGNKGVSVVDAFEGYAYDAGIRVGDRILSVDGVDTRQMSVDKVRDLLRGDPDTEIVVEVSRNGENDRKSVETRKLQRQLVKISDVRIATLLGNPSMWNPHKKV
jgi:C-terminal processing protease CtpA/Prc